MPRLPLYRLALFRWVLPLCAAVLIALFTLRDRVTSASLSIGAVLGGFFLSIVFISWAGWHPARAESVVN